MQTVITDTNYEKTLSLLKSEYESLSANGCFFAIMRTEYDSKGNVKNDFFDVISFAVKVGYEYVNTIVYPSSISQKCAFTDNVKYVVWLCKKHSQMKFIKDAIRERHIWKDVEWGKREKNYNPKGKDPGNVWIPTEDDGKAHITNHLLLDDSEVIKRLLDMSCCGNDYILIRDDYILLNECRDSVYANLASREESSKVIFKSSEEMSEISDGNIKAVITSPPYWNLKDYFKKGQIGQESYEIYLERLKTVWTQCYKKLSENGTLWININIRVHNGQVINIPRDFIKVCREIGFFYKGVIIWHKSSGIPTGDSNIVDRHEYILIFSKNEEFSVNRIAFSEFADYKNSVINGGAFWNINRKAGSVGKKYIHPAIYPNDLVARIIAVSTNPGDTVLDPFLGSGTTIIAAEQCNRVCIGYEYNEGFEDLIKSRFNTEIPDAVVEFIK